MKVENTCLVHVRCESEPVYGGEALKTSLEKRASSSFFYRNGKIRVGTRFRAEIKDLFLRKGYHNIFIKSFRRIWVTGDTRTQMANKGHFLGPVIQLPA